MRKVHLQKDLQEVYEAPAAIKDKLADIPGIGEVQARIIKEARLTDIWRWQAD